MIPVQSLAAAVSSTTIEDLEVLAREKKAADIAKVPFKGFFLICVKGTADEMTRALRGGADPNAGDPDHGGTPPLTLAAAHTTDPNVIRALLKAGADVNHPGLTYKRTALHMAVLFNPKPAPIVQALVEAKPRLFRSDIQDMTPLDYALAGKAETGQAFDGIPRDDVVLILLRAAAADAPAPGTEKQRLRYFTACYKDYLRAFSGNKKPNKDVVAAFHALGVQD